MSSEKTRERERERERESLGCFLDTYSVRSFTRGSGRVGDDPKIETTMLLCHYCCLQKTRKKSWFAVLQIVRNTFLFSFLTRL
jgi:hypothetical protein